jgi:hypothetical protein
MSRKYKGARKFVRKGFRPRSRVKARRARKDKKLKQLAIQKNLKARTDKERKEMGELG